MKGSINFSSITQGCQYMLFLIAASLSLSIAANHEKTEPSDGTVRSFKVVSSRAAVPSFTFFDQSMQPSNIHTFKGKIVLLNICAAWCGPCLREMPALDRLQAKFDKSQFIILHISIDREGVSVTAPFYHRLGIQNLHFFHDPSLQLGTFFPLDVVPANFIIDRDGNLVSFLRSFVDWDDQLAYDMIEYYVQQEEEHPLAWSDK